MTTTVRKSGGSWTGDTSARQITELAHAFQGFAHNVPGLTVEVVGNVAGNRNYVHPVAGFHVHLRDGSGVGISLYVSSRYGELVRWQPGTGAQRERFDVHIDEPGYGWGESTFPTAHELAHDLFAYMQFNLDALLKS